MSTKSNFRNYLNVYEFECTLPGSKEIVKYKPITTGQLKQLLIYENEENPIYQEKAIDELITSSVISENFDIKNLYLEDRLFLLIEIRKKTKGEIIKIDYKCPKCKKVTEINIDLNDLKVKEKQDDINNKIKLNDNIVLELKHIKRSDQIVSEKYIDKSMQPNQQMVDMQILSYASSITNIITPDGEENPPIMERKYLLENIPTSLFDKVKKWHEDNTFGIDFKYKSKCLLCQEINEIDMPLDNFFL